MNIREKMEQQELELLNPYAAHSAHSRGRERAEEECDVRTVYQRDRDRILHSKAFRRLKDKTQVFLAPHGDHYRNRLTHTLEVSQIARTIAKALRLNEDLVEAIALGHDLGHTPFGHAGEHALNEIHPGGFAQNEKFYTELSFRPDESVLKIDRKFSGTERALVHQRRCLVNGDANELKLRVILDRFSAEIFINDGEQVMSAVIFTEQEAKGISFFAEGAAKIDIVKYNLV